MARRKASIAYLDGPRLSRAVAAGIAHLFQRRDLLNRINVFPVPDGDTGTNLAFTFKTVLDALKRKPKKRVDELLDLMANAALDGARGNSGAILAQYFHGFSDAIRGHRLLTANSLATAAAAGARSAWKAMANPVPGTMPTVLEDFSSELVKQEKSGEHDLRQLLRLGLQRARESLANTPNLLPVLRQAGVVDAGAQGFVDFLDGMAAYVETGRMDAVPADLDNDDAFAVDEFEVGEHRYCTECVIESVTGPSSGSAGSTASLDRDAIMQAMQKLDSSSLVVAGGASKVRVHIHVNQPAEVFLAAEAFGNVTQQKADDMQRQHGLMNHKGKVAVVTDSGGDIPQVELERLAIHVVPVRLSFGEREYLDRVTLSSEEFYRLLQETPQAPKTSQPPAQDFSRVYSLLTSHQYEVVSVGISTALSGTTSAALSAASRQADGMVRVFDSLNASAGQGLLAILAAEAAERGFEADEIEALLLAARPQCRVFAIANDLTYAVRGGRLKAWVKWLADHLHLNPVLTATPKGTLGLAGFHLGRGAQPERLVASACKHMQPDQMYRVIIAHANTPEGAAQTRRALLARHQRIHSCHITEAGSALGVHLGPGGLVLAYVPQVEQLASP
ncbi:MAG TPA: DegV family protein [Xanthomonadales bacterium]|nr:DegV family protein [Xanthomonadales bacterium]